MTNHETSLSPSGPISYTFQPDPAISEVDNITNNLRSLLEKLDNLKVEASSSSQISPQCDRRNVLPRTGCQAFLQKMTQATNDFQEFARTDQLIRIPSIEQPNQILNETIEGDLTVSEIVGEDLVFYEDNIEEDYENLFKELSPIASSFNEDQTFSRDCYYLEDPSLIIQEEDHEDHENILADHNVDTISMSNSHVDLVEVNKERCNQSSDDHDLSTNLSIEFDIQEDCGQNDSLQDDGMILKLLDKESEMEKQEVVQIASNIVDLGSNGAI